MSSSLPRPGVASPSSSGFWRLSPTGSSSSKNWASSARVLSPLRSESSSGRSIASASVGPTSDPDPSTPSRSRASSDDGGWSVKNASNSSSNSATSRSSLTIVDCRAIFTVSRRARSIRDSARAASIVSGAEMRIPRALSRAPKRTSVVNILP